MNADSYGDALDMALNRINEQSKRIEKLTAQVGVLREAVSEALRNPAGDYTEEILQEALATAPESALGEVRRAEREKCAKVCDELRHPDGYSCENVDWCAGADHCAAAIRAME